MLAENVQLLNERIRDNVKTAQNNLNRFKGVLKWTINKNRYWSKQRALADWRDAILLARKIAERIDDSILGVDDPRYIHLIDTADRAARSPQDQSIASELLEAMRESKLFSDYECRTETENNWIAHPDVYSRYVRTIRWIKTALLNKNPRWLKRLLSYDICNTFKITEMLHEKIMETPVSIHTPYLEFAGCDANMQVYMVYAARTIDGVYYPSNTVIEDGFDNRDVEPTRFFKVDISVKNNVIVKCVLESTDEQV